jgi:membrane fusion protein (multidrug efflux system)
LCDRVGIIYPRRRPLRDHRQRLREGRHAVASAPTSPAGGRDRGAQQPARAGGQLLFRIDEEPFQTERQRVRPTRFRRATTTAALQATYRGKLADIRAAEGDLTYYDREFAPPAELAQRNYAPQAKVDEARRALEPSASASPRCSAGASTLAQLGGDPTTVEPANVRMAQVAGRQGAARLRRTAVYAPMAGIVTNVDKLQVGHTRRGQAAFSLVAIDQLWSRPIRRRPDLTWSAPGSATVDGRHLPRPGVDGARGSSQPRDGAEFAVLPAQNASGNWVKVCSACRCGWRSRCAGRAAAARRDERYISIDTGRKRTPRRSRRDAARFVGF